MRNKNARPWRLLAAVGLVVTLACGCAGQPAVDDAVDHGGSLVSEEGHVMNSDGSGLTQLTDSLAEDFYPAWRP
jgi:hypothetical protein